MLVFQEKGKLKNLEKNPQSEAPTNNKHNSHTVQCMIWGWNQALATLAGGDTLNPDHLQMHKGGKKITTVYYHSPSFRDLGKLDQR